ncbi:VWA domain-containing protein [Cutibacterium equinum]|uniref:VWA domain-containing protein n=1 Tax=Cutibacterium equinum TaxID=3016342 RepID=A0ABY7QYS5_9ACTN|nr:VWA domain-containing protein [Cutibacterium equinum]WCC79850.1 VWA domain-containing protein [Cutibacterium equinum]
MINFLPNWWLTVPSAAVLAYCTWRWASSRARSWRWGRMVVIGLCLTMIGLRPIAGQVMTTEYQSGADVVMLIDKTTSMAAEDFDGNHPRMDAVRKDALNLVQQLNGARFAVVVFDNNARVVLPFTTDASAVASLLETMDWRRAEDGNGSDIGIASSEAQKLLENSKKRRPDGYRQLIYFGDGEQTKKSEPTSFQNLRGLISNGLFISYGTSTGGRMKISPLSSQYVKYKDKDAISKANPAAVKNLAVQAGGIFTERTSNNQPLTVDTSDVKTIEVTRKDPRGFELYPFFAGPLGLLLIFELFGQARAFRLTRSWK